MANVVIDHPDAVALIEGTGTTVTNGDKTEVVAVAMRQLPEQMARAGSLFGMYCGSVRLAEGVGFDRPALDVEPVAETSREVER